MGKGIQKFNYIKIDRKYLASMEKGINSEDDEWVQNLIHIMEKVLKLKQRITYTYDFKLFNKYGNPSDTVSRGDWGGCSPNEGFISAASKINRTIEDLIADTVRRYINWSKYILFYIKISR